MKIILSSNSQTRKKILNHIGIKFLQKNPPVNEEEIKQKLLISKRKPRIICQILAKEKSLSNSLNFPNYFCIGVDSCLIFKNKFLSKPASKKKAKEMLVLLNGQKHVLYSSIYISMNGKKTWQFSDEATLKLYKLSNKKMDNYIKRLSLKNIKTSGLYQIEGKGAELFEKIEGDFFTILGLPLIPLLGFFKKRNINAWK